MVPNIGLNREHVLRIGTDNVVSNRETLTREAKSFGIKNSSKADEIIETIFHEVSNWEQIFYEFKVPDNDIKAIGRDITKRMAKIES